MSNLYSKIAAKPAKRMQDNMVSQTNAWMNGMKLCFTANFPVLLLFLSNRVFKRKLVRKKHDRQKFVKE